MFVDNSKYKSFGGRDPIIHNFDNDSYYQDFVDKLYDVWNSFLSVTIKNEYKPHLFLSNVLPTNHPYVHMETIMEKFYISSPIGKNIIDDKDISERMSYTFFRECVTLLNMFQSDTTDPIKLYQKRITTIYKTYWTEDRWEKIRKEEQEYRVVLDSVPPYLFDKGYKAYTLASQIYGNVDRARFEWIDFEYLLFLPLDLAYNKENKLDLIHKDNMLQQLVFNWINHLYSYRNNPYLNVSKLKEIKRAAREYTNLQRISDKLYDSSSDE